MTVATMKNLKKLVPTLVVFGAVLTSAVWTWAAGAGDPANLIPYAGRLELNGVPVEGSVNIKFDLYDDANPGSSSITWSETHTVTAAAGRFSAVLGTQSAIPNAAFDAAELYVEVTVDGTSLGLQRIYATADAQRAARATLADDATNAANATNATNATNAEVAERLTCPNSTLSEHGICVERLPQSGPAYIYNMYEAVDACAAADMHVCSLAELNTAYVGGYRHCAYGWVADWYNNGNGWVAFPTAGGTGCGTQNGLQPDLTPWSQDSSVFCCR